MPAGRESYGLFVSAAMTNIIQPPKVSFILNPEGKSTSTLKPLNEKERRKGASDFTGKGTELCTHGHSLLLAPGSKQFFHLLT